MSRWRGATRHRRWRLDLVLMATAALAAAPSQALPAGETAVEKALCAAPPAGTQARTQPATQPAPCRLVKLESAGSDTAGQALFVAEVAHSAQADFASPHDPCLRYEYDLVVLAGDAVARTQPLSYVCNDGLTSPGCPAGSVTFTVGPNRFERTYEAYYGCNVSRSHEVFQLSPLKRLAEESDGERTAAGSTDRSEWDWQRYQGRSEQTQEIGFGEDEATAHPLHQRYGETARRSAVWIPRLDLGADYSKKDWRALALGTCAARVTGDGDGFLVFGGGADPATAELRVLATSRNELIVEVYDDRVVSGAASWLDDDHLELWLAPAIPWSLLESGEDALDALPAASQWGIRLSDAKVFPAHGRPSAALTVERQAATRADGKPVVRLRIEIPAALGSAPQVTIVYSDSDGGRRQERLIATSDLDAKHVWTLGDSDPPPANRVRCEARAGALDFVDAQQYRADESAISQ